MRLAHCINNCQSKDLMSFLAFQPRTQHRRELELEIRQRDMRLENSSWEQIRQDIIDHDEIRRKRAEREEEQRYVHYNGLGKISSFKKDPIPG